MDRLQAGPSCVVHSKVDKQTAETLPLEQGPWTQAVRIQPWSEQIIWDGVLMSEQKGKLDISRTIPIKVKTINL